MTSFYGGGGSSGGSSGTISLSGGFLGVVADGATDISLPATHQIGDVYKVVTAGTYAGIECAVGDVIICVAAGSSSSDSDWAVVQGKASSESLLPTLSGADDAGKYLAVNADGTGYILVDAAAANIGDTLELTSLTIESGGSINVGGVFIIKDGGIYSTDGSTLSNIEVATPTTDNQIANKSYVDSVIAAIDGFVSKTGDTMSGNLDMGGNSIKNLADGTEDTDAATVGQVNELKITLDEDSGTYSLRQNNELIGTWNAGESAGAAVIRGVLADKVITLTMSDNTTVAIDLSGLDAAYVDQGGDSVTGIFDFSDGTVIAAAPTEDSHVATKEYVDGAIADIEGGDSTAIQEAIDNIESGATELPYLKKTGDTGTGNYTLGNSVQVETGYAISGGNGGQLTYDDSTGALGIYNSARSALAALDVAVPTAETNATPKSYVDAIDTKIGDLSILDTTDKTDVVTAINETLAAIEVATDDEFNEMLEEILN